MVLHVVKKNYKKILLFFKIYFKLDCGLPELLKVSGFCNKHGSDRISSPEAPVDLIISFEIVFSKLIYRILQELRVSGSFGN
jgi:hypothetical protein